MTAKAEPGVATPPALASTYPVLCIEDDPANLRLMERVLARRGGAQLFRASTGRMGIELARRHWPHAILLDLHLPDLGGEQVMGYLQRARRPATPGPIWPSRLP